MYQARQYDVIAASSFERIIHARLPRHRPASAEIEADEVVRESAEPHLRALCEPMHRYRIVFHDDAAFPYFPREFERLDVAFERPFPDAIDNCCRTWDCCLELPDPFDPALVSDDDGLHSCSNCQGRGLP